MRVMLSWQQPDTEAGDNVKAMGDLVVIGSGIAGHSAVLELRRVAPDQTVQIIGAETGRPYDRPPLSKDFLLADTPKLPLLGQSDIYDDGVTLRDGVSATAIDCDRHIVTLSDGATVAYDKLLLATGSRLRKMPFSPADQQRVFYLRTVDDARRLRAALRESRRVAIIGGGFIGLEVAAAARQLDCDVTVLEQAPALLSRGSTPQLARYVRDMHAEHGSDIILDASVDEIVFDASGVTLRWQDGDLRADIVVIGIGIIPNMELAAEAGIASDDGILVDHRCRTSDADVFAAGEVTNYPIGALHLRARTESWSAAGSQAAVAARNMVGEDCSFDELPWFWSDQFDANVQCLGLPRRASRYLRIGDMAEGKWMRIGLDVDDRLVGAECVNMGREMSALRRADRNGQPVPPALLDRAVPERGEAVAELVEEPPLRGMRC